MMEKQAGPGPVKENSLKEKTGSGKGSAGCRSLLFLWFFAAWSLEYLELQCSFLYMKKELVLLNLPLFFLNLLLIIFVHLLLRLFSGSWKVSFYLSAFLFFLWGQANFYTICFHGSPLFFSDLVNARAALALCPGYRLHFLWINGLIGLCFLVEMAMDLYFCPRYFPGKSIRTWRKEGLVLLASLACILTFMTGFHLLHIFRNDYVLGWKWYDNIADNGFFYCWAEDCRNTLFPYKSDDPFRDNPLYALEKDLGNAGERDLEKTKEKDLEKTKEKDLEKNREIDLEKPSLLPDIILILNESFYDLNICSDITADRDYLEGFYSINRASYGFVNCPNIGGRTNDSEYELLTGCSMDRLRASAPFNYLDLTQGPSLARLLDKLGYETTAMHCGQPSIYARDRGYRDLGFSHVLLGEDQFHYYGRNGNREWLDKDNYRDLLDRYKKSGSGPRFFYLMTYQNHGGYDQNDPGLDTVHVTGLAGPLREELDEYLSSVSLSVQAFRWLIARLAHSSRPVVVCMLGDHSPPFLSQLPVKSSGQNTNPDQDADAGREEILRRVPYIVWSNKAFALQTMGKGQGEDGSKPETDTEPETDTGIEDRPGQGPDHDLVTESHRKILDMTDLTAFVLRDVFSSCQQETSSSDRD